MIGKKIPEHVVNKIGKRATNKIVETSKINYISIVVSKLINDDAAIFRIFHCP